MLSLQKGCLVMRSAMATSTNALRPPPPPPPRQYRTDCATRSPDKIHLDISHLVCHPTNAGGLRVYIYIYIAFFDASSGEDVTRDTFPGVNFPLKRNWDPKEIELVPDRLFPGLKRAQGKQRRER